MEKEFVTFEQAITLKELGFDEPCFAWYSTKGVFYVDDSANRTIELNTITNRGSFANAILAPLKQQVFSWFREKYNLFGCIDLQYSNPAHWYIRVDDIIKNDFVYHSEDYHIKYKTYEEAENACIDKLIELIYV